MKSLRVDALILGALLVASTAPAPSQAQVPPYPPELESPGGALYLNAGGTAVVDVIGRTWAEDFQYLATDTNVAVNNEEFVFYDISLISDPNFPAWLYRSERWLDGDIEYRIYVHNAPYKVYLYFAETCPGCVGPAMGGVACPACQRIFDVEVEGDRRYAFSAADAALGAPSDGVGTTFKGTELVFDAVVTDGVLNIRVIDRGTGNPPENSNIFALKVIRMPSELATPGTPLRLNAGANAITDTLGRVWRPDGAFVSTADTFIVDTPVSIDVSRLEDTRVPGLVFRSERTNHGSFGYEIPVMNGIYETRLYFAETCSNCVSPQLGGTGCSTCSREFDVRVENRTVSAFNAADAALRPPTDGSGEVRIASELVFYTNVEDNFLSIRLDDRNGADLSEDPRISALAITRLDARVLGPVEPVLLGVHVSDRDQLFLLETPQGKPTLVTADPSSAATPLSIYSRWQGIPSPSRHDGAASTPDADPACLTVEGRTYGSSLVLVHADSAAPEKYTVTVIADQKSLALKSLTPERSAPDEAGFLSATARGLGFRSGMTFQLRRHGGAATLDAVQTTVVSGARAEILFQVGAADPTGVYDLIARRTDPEAGREPLTATLDSAFTLRARTKGPLVSFSLDGYGAYRRGELSRVILRYRNEGDSDVIAPIFKVEAPSSVHLRLREDDELRTNALLILGIDEENVAGRLSPGSRWHEVHVYFLSDRQNSTELKASILTEADTDTLDWSSLPAPPGLNASQWSNLRAKLANRAGNSWRELHESLAAAATRLHARGDDATDVATLFRFLSREALDLPSSSVSGRVVDLSTGEPVKGAEVLARFGGGTESYGVTNGDGRFTIDWLRSGRSYSLDIRDWTSNVVTAVIPANGGDTLGVELLAAVQADSLSAGCPNCQEGGLPKEPVSPPSNLFAGVRSHLLEEVRSEDPNEKHGPRHPDMPGMEDTTCAGDEVGYQIRFENIGAAAAVHVVVRDVVEGVALERRKFRFVEVELPGVTFPLTTLVEGGVYTAATQDYGASETVEGVGVGGGVCVLLSGAYDPLTGALEVHLDAVDPLTGAAPELPTLGVVAQGEHGSVSFAVGAKDGSMAEPDEDTEVKNSGEIIFDSNPPIQTNTFVNRFSRCEPGTPHSPVPADDVARGQGTELALGWACDPADSFDVYLGVAGTPRTLRASALPERGYRLTGLLPNRVYEWQVVARNSRGTTTGPVWHFSTSVGSSDQFLRGDANSDGNQDLSDAVFILSYLFLGGTTPACTRALDVDDDGVVIITDPVALLSHLFIGLPPPPPPFAACGTDNTPDSLPCASHPACR